MKKNENYLTVKDLSKYMNISQRQIRNITKRLLKSGYDDRIIQGKPILIHTSIKHLFYPVYKRTIETPKKEIVLKNDWSIFGDFLPVDGTPKDVLIAIMDALFDYLKKKLTTYLTMYYVIEKQPKSGLHVHFFIEAPVCPSRLKALIIHRLTDLIWSEHYYDGFRKELKVYAYNYLTKGKAFNFKDSVLLHEALIIAGKRGHEKVELPWWVNIKKSQKPMIIQPYPKTSIF